MWRRMSMALPFWRQKGHVLGRWAGSHKAFDCLGARIAALGVAAGLAGPGSGCGRPGRPGRHHGLEAALLCLHGPRRPDGSDSLLPCLLLRGLRNSYPRGVGGRMPNLPLRCRGGASANLFVNNQNTPITYSPHQGPEVFYFVITFDHANTFGEILMLYSQSVSPLAHVSYPS